MNKILIMVCFAGFAMASLSCKKKQINSIENNVVEGSWTVSSYQDDGENETSDFSGDVFTFNSDGTLIVSGTHPSNGSWSIRKDSSSDDDLFDDHHLEFVINLPAPLDELSDDWEIEEQSSTRIELKDKSGNSDNGEDYLTFTKQ